MLADTPLPHGFGAALASVDTFFQRAPEQFVTSPLCLVGYVRWDARSDRVPPLQTIIFSSFPGRTKSCRPSGSLAAVITSAPLGERSRLLSRLDERSQHGFQRDSSLSRARLSALELDPAFVGAIKHLDAGCGVLHALRFE